MPTKTARKGARKAKRRGNKPSTQAGSYVKQQSTLKSGKGGKGGKVKSRKQAIAIGLSEARAKGAKVPRKRTSKRSARKK